jgi:hypothetical protein
MSMPAAPAMAAVAQIGCSKSAKIDPSTMWRQVVVASDGRNDVSNCPVNGRAAWYVVS